MIAVIIVLIFFQPFIVLAPEVEAKWEREPITAYFAEPSANAMAYDPSSDTLYVATQRGLLINHTQSGVLEMKTIFEGLLSNKVYSLLWDSEHNRLFIGSGGGVSIYWPNNDTIGSINVKRTDGLDDSILSMTYNEINDVLYLGSYSDGFFILDLATQNVISKREGSGFIDGAVIDIVYDWQTRRLFMALVGIIAIYDLESETYELLESDGDFEPAFGIHKLALDTNHRILYMGSNHDLFLYNLTTGSIQNHTLYDWGNPVSDYRDLVFDEERSLMYLGYVSGLVVENTSTGSYDVHDFPGYMSNTVETMCLALSSPKAFISIRMSGIIVFDNITQQSMSVIMGDGLRYDRVHTLAVEPGISLFISTENANTQRFFPATEQFETVHNWPASAFLYEESKDIMFIGAVERYHDEAVYLYDISTESLSLLIGHENFTNRISDMAYDPSANILYVACGLGLSGEPGKLLVYDIDQNEIVNYNESSGLLNSDPISLGLDLDSQTLYIGNGQYYVEGIKHPGGITILDLDNGTFDTLNSSDGMSWDDVEDVIWDSERKCLWIASNMLNCYYPNNHSFEIFKSVYGFNSPTMTMDNLHNKLYFGIPSGFVIFDIIEKHFQYVDRFYGLLNEHVWSIACDPGLDKVYLGSFDGGLYIFDVAEYETLPRIVFNPPDTLEDRVLVNITCDIINNNEIDEVRMYYSNHFSGPFEFVRMNWAQELGLFSAPFLPQSIGGYVYLYIEAQWSGETHRDPNLDVSSHTVKLVDNTPPFIEHEPPDNLTAGESYSFWITVEDNRGVAEIEMIYLDPISNISITVEPQQYQDRGYYVTLDIDENAEGYFNYYFWASDEEENKAYLPPEGESNQYEIQIVQKDDSTENNIDDGTDDASDDDQPGDFGKASEESSFWILLVLTIVILLLIVMIFLFRRRKKGDQHSSKDVSEPPPDNIPKPP